MMEYKTTHEMAAEWNVSPQHVQYLCRKGRIEGATKRGTMWFIPGDTPNPLQYTKSDVDGFRFVGTKSKIFDSAIDLFMRRGFNDVSIKNIADQVGIQQSTIYNHFESKQQILDTIYDFYCHHFLIDRPSLDEMEPVLQNGSLMDIISAIRYDFREDYEQKMSDISNIIFQRIAVDARAREIGKSLIVENGLRYTERVFDRGVEIGRFPPFHTHTIATLINYIRICTLYLWIVDPSPEGLAKLAEDEHALYQCAAKLLTDLKIPAKED